MSKPSKPDPQPDPGGIAKPVTGQERVRKPSDAMKELERIQFNVLDHLGGER